MASLIVEFGGDIAKFITATTKMDVQARKTAKAIGREFESLGAKLAGVVSVGLATKFVKDVIDTQDALSKLSQKTGVAIQDLSALRYAGELAGAPIEDIGKGMKKLAGALTEAHEPTTKAGQLMKALGVNIDGGAMPAMNRIADVFKAMPDGTTKATLAVELFGKAGMNMIPLLNEGSEGLEKMRREAEALGVVFDAERAKDMERFNDNLTRVKFSAEGAAVNLTNSLAPAMVRVTNAMAEAAKAEGAWGAIKVGAGGVMAEMLGLNDDAVTVRIREINKELLDLAEIKAQGPGILETIFGDQTQNLERRIQMLKGELVSIQLLADAQAGKFADASDRRTGAAARVAEAEKRIQLAEEAKKKAKELNDILSGASTKTPVGTELLMQLNQEYTKLTAGVGEATRAQEIMFELQKSSYKLISPQIKAEVIAMAEKIDKKKEELDTIEREKKAREILGKVIVEQLKVRDEERKIIEGFESDMASQIADMQFEATLYGKSAREIAKLTEARRIDLRVRAEIAALPKDDMGEPDYEAVKRMLDGAERMKKITLEQIDINWDLAESTQNVAGIWNQMADYAASFAKALMEGPKKALEYLRNLAKQLLAEMIAIFAKRWVLQMAAGITGSTGLAAQASQIGSGTFSGFASNAISSALGLGATASAFGTGFGAGFAGSAAVPMAEYAIPALGTTSGSFGATLGTLAANPITWIVAAAVAAVLIIRSREGGPKPGGSFFGTYDAAGNFLGTSAVPGTDNGRFFTPSDQDSAMRTMTDSFATTFFDTLTRLGGTTGALSFGFGTDQDPRGSAANRVAGAIYRDGMQIFRSLVEAGRDDEDLQRAFSLTMKRMLLAGLQSSELPNGLARILNTVSAATGTEEEIDKVIALATAFGDLMTAVTAPFTASGVIEEATRTAPEQFRLMGEALLEAADNADMTVEDLNALTQGTVQFRQAAAALIITLNNLKAAAIATIDGLIEQTALAGMDPQQQFNYWQDKANSLFAQMMSSTDPAEIERLLGQFNTAWSNAWSLLSPEQQASEGAAWRRNLESARTLISEHIDDLIDGIVTDTNDVLKVVGDKMDAAADKFGEAAATQNSAANTFAGAVSEGVKVYIIVDQYGNAIVNESGQAA